MDKILIKLQGMNEKTIFSTHLFLFVLFGIEEQKRSDIAIIQSVLSMLG